MMEGQKRTKTRPAVRLRVLTASSCLSHVTSNAWSHAALAILHAIVDNSVVMKMIKWSTRHRSGRVWLSWSVVACFAILQTHYEGPPALKDHHQRLLKWGEHRLKGYGDKAERQLLNNSNNTV